MDLISAQQYPICEILFLVGVSEPPGQSDAVDEFVARLTEKRERVRRVAFRNREPTARLNVSYFVIALFLEIEGSDDPAQIVRIRSEEHTSELQSLMRLSYAAFCLNTKNSSSSITTNTD